jgi:hypothetical protein
MADRCALYQEFIDSLDKQLQVIQGQEARESNGALKQHLVAEANMIRQSLNGAEMLLKHCRQTPSKQSSRAI